MTTTPNEIQMIVRSVSQIQTLSELVQRFAVNGEIPDSRDDGQHAARILDVLRTCETKLENIVIDYDSRRWQ